MLRDQARRARGGGRRRRRRARRLRRLPAARPQLPARRASGSPGLGLADLETVREPGPRLIGNVAIEADLGGEPAMVAGFENHGGRTHLGAGAEPLGRVIAGHGNNGADGLEGVRAPEPDRHLPARPAAAEERLARRPPDRARARPPRRARSPSSSRSTTSSSAPRTSRARAAASRSLDQAIVQREVDPGIERRGLCREPRVTCPRSRSRRRRASVARARRPRPAPPRSAG